MFTLKARQFRDKINEQKKWFEVDVEYEVEVSVRPHTMKVSLDGADETFGEEPIAFDSVKTRFSGSKTFEVEADSESEARKKFEDLKDVNKWEADLYIGTDYVAEGFEREIADANIKVIEVRELEP